MPSPTERTVPTSSGPALPGRCPRCAAAGMLADLVWLDLHLGPLSVLGRHAPRSGGISSCLMDAASRIAFPTWKSQVPDDPLHRRGWSDRPACRSAFQPCVGDFPGPAGSSSTALVTVTSIRSFPSSRGHRNRAGSENRRHRCFSMSNSRKLEFGRGPLDRLVRAVELLLRGEVGTEEDRELAVSFQGIAEL